MIPLIFLVGMLSAGELADKLSHGWPSSEWMLSGDDYSVLRWSGPERKPTEAEIRAVELPKRYRAFLRLPSGAVLVEHRGKGWTSADISFLKAQGYVVEEVR